MFNRKLLLISLLTVVSWLGAMAQTVVNVHGSVINENGSAEQGVDILVSVFFADSTAVLQSTTTDSIGYYTVDVQTPGPNIFGFMEVSMVDCWGTTQSQYFNILSGEEVFEAENFIY